MQSNKHPNKNDSHFFSMEPYWAWDDYKLIWGIATTLRVYRTGPGHPVSAAVSTLDFKKMGPLSQRSCHHPGHLHSLLVKIQRRWLPMARFGVCGHWCPEAVAVTLGVVELSSESPSLLSKAALGKCIRQGEDLVSPALKQEKNTAVHCRPFE